MRQGCLGCERPGQAPQYGGVGQSVTSTPDDAHRFWNAGEDDLRCSDYMQPVDNIEYFLSEVFASQARYGTRPDHFDAV